MFILMIVNNLNWNSNLHNRLKLSSIWNGKLTIFAMLHVLFLLLCYCFLLHKKRPQIAPEGTKWHYNFQNFPGEAPRTPPMGGGHPLPYLPPASAAPTQRRFAPSGPRTYKPAEYIYKPADVILSYTPGGTYIDGWGLMLHIIKLCTILSVSWVV